ncbi:hypothetical protein EV426DRAFT_536233 [Tirmania nivea]|nr:hypothetical protein EV426DRAFT_536233 [Tirmania nivea]
MNFQDLEAAINYGKAAVESISDNHSQRARWLNNLGNSFCRRYERTRNLQDLEAAINYAVKQAAISYAVAAVEATSEDHSDRARWLNILGIRSDLKAAIRRAEAVVQATPRGSL